MVTTTTRLQEFRQRNNRQSQLRSIVVVTCTLVVYSYCLLGFQTQQAHHEVVRLNLERSRQAWMEQFYAVQARELMAEQRTKDGKLKKWNRAERLRLRQEQHESLKLYKFNQTSTNLQIDTIILNMTTTSSKDEADEPAGNTGNNIFDVLAFYMIIRLASRMVTLPRQQRAGQQQQQQQQNTPSTAIRRRTITPQQQIINNQRFRRWADELNRQREAQGERPLSLDALRLVLRERQTSDGTDYDGLLEFQEQSGPAMEALLRSLGATNEQIERLPCRTLGANDDLLQPSHGRFPDCSICLENFSRGDEVRTIPCFHSFHKGCIDPWLTNKAECPVCKHSAIA